MNELRAILWLDWRLVRRDFAVLAALAALSPPLLGLFAPANSLAAVLAFAFLPCTATLLGSTLSAGDAALPFLHARATSWPRLVALRLAHRCLLATTVALVGLLSAAFLSPAGGLVREFVVGPAFLIVPSLLVVFGLTAAGALSSAHAREPLLCVFVGWVLYLGLFTGAMTVAAWVGTQWFGFDPGLGRLVVWVPSVLGLGLLAWAIAGLTTRTSARPLRVVRGLVIACVTAPVLLAILVGVPAWRAAKAQERVLAAWEEVGVETHSGPELKAEWLQAQESAVHLLAEAGLWPEWRGRDGLANQLGFADQRLRRLESPPSWAAEAELKPAEEILAELEELLDRIETLALREDLSEAQRLGLSWEASSATIPLRVRAELAHRAGDDGRAIRSLEAAWRLQEPLLPGPRWPWWHEPSLLRLRGLLEAWRQGVPGSETVRTELRGVDLRSGLDDVAWTESWVRTEAGSASARRWLRPGLVSRTAEASLGLASFVDDLRATRACELVDEPEADVVEPDTNGLVKHAVSRWNQAVSLSLELELTVQVLDRRAGKSFDPASSCPDARWRLDEHPDGSWSILLENGPIDLRHDEPPNTRAE